MSRHQLNSHQLGSLSITFEQLHQTLRDMFQDLSANIFYEFIDCSSSTQTFELPDPDIPINSIAKYIIKKIDSTNNYVIITSLGTNKTIDGQSSIALSEQYDSVTLKSHNGQWYIV